MSCALFCMHAIKIYCKAKEGLWRYSALGVLPTVLSYHIAKIKVGPRTHHNHGKTCKSEGNKNSHTSFSCH